MKRLILLCDYGLDDAVATVALLKHKDLFCGIDILPVGGNVPERTAFLNAMRLLGAYDGDIGDIKIVDTSAIEQPCEFLTDIHGIDGMGGLYELPQGAVAPVEDFFEWVKTVDAENSFVISLGPCTVTKILLEKAGKMPLLLMGDHVKEPPNYKGFEFNYGINPPAFAACLKYPHVVATLDTCHIAQLDYYEENTMQDKMLWEMVEKDRQMCVTRGFDKTCVYDYIAVCSLIYPERYNVKTVTDPFGNIINQLEYISEKRLDM